MSNTISIHHLHDALEVADLDHEVTIRTDYSGRGMYGDQCFGLVFEQEVRHPWAFFAALGIVQESMDPPDFDALELARAARSDSMGVGTIVYFPGWTVES